MGGGGGIRVAGQKFAGSIMLPINRPTQIKTSKLPAVTKRDTRSRNNTKFVSLSALLFVRERRRRPWRSCRPSRSRRDRSPALPAARGAGHLLVFYLRTLRFANMVHRRNRESPYSEISFIENVVSKCTYKLIRRFISYT